MEELYKPHDTFFRAVFTQEDNARDLLLGTMPVALLDLLDLQSLEVEDTSFIDGKLAVSHSDLLIRTRLHGTPALIYILVEHKSHPDRWAVFQLFRYMNRIWERERSTSGRAKTLPVMDRVNGNFRSTSLPILIQKKDWKDISRISIP